MQATIKKQEKCWRMKNQRVALRKSLGSILPISSHPPVQSSSTIRRDALRGISITMKRRAGEPIKHHCQRHLQPLVLRTPTVFTNTESSWQSCQLFLPLCLLVARAITAVWYAPQLWSAPWDPGATEPWHLWGWSCYCSEPHLWVPGYYFDLTWPGLSCPCSKSLLPGFYMWPSQSCVSAILWLYSGTRLGTLAHHPQPMLLPHLALWAQDTTATCPPRAHAAAFHSPTLPKSLWRVPETQMLVI